MSLNKEEMDELRRVAQDAYKSSNERDDDYDELIADIILIEKSHKYISTGEANKLSQINKKIEDFLGNNN